MNSRLFSFFLSSHWAMEPAIFDQMRAILERHELGEKLAPAAIRAAIGRAPQTPNPRNRTYDLHQGTAIIPVNGVLSKHSAGVNDISQPEGTSAQEIQDALRCALADPEVASVLLHIESPGGQVDGTSATADCVKMVSKAKPVWAFADGLCASAAYYIASAADRIVATAAAQVGSVGVMAVLRDTSKADEKAGMRTVVVRSGPKKALGSRGEPITNDTTDSVQRIVDGLAQQFYDAVIENRQISADQMNEVRSGQVYLAQEAKDLGLIDAIGTFEATLQDLSEPSKRVGNKPVRRDSTQTPPRAQTMNHDQAIKAFDAKVAELKSKGSKTPTKDAAHKFPDLHAAYVAALNARTAATTHR